MVERIKPEYKNTVNGIYAAVLIKMATACVLTMPASTTILYKGTMDVNGGMIIIEISSAKTALFSLVSRRARG